MIPYVTEIRISGVDNGNEKWSFAQSQSGVGISHWVQDVAGLSTRLPRVHELDLDILFDQGVSIHLVVG